MQDCESESLMNYCSQLAALKVRSPFLAKVLDLIIKKLSRALQSMVIAMVKTVVFPQALKLSKIAQSWGYEDAKMWICDRKSAKFLVIMHLNAFPMDTMRTQSKQFKQAESMKV